MADDPKFRASSSWKDVTTFQPTRPPLIWSIEAKARAVWKGVAKVVEVVATRPIFSVIGDRAARSDRGSSESLSRRPSVPLGTSIIGKAT